MDWLTRVSMKINQFMAGRYGGDRLSIALLILYCILILIANIAGLPIISLLALLLLIWSIYRIFSRNIFQRQRENAWFLKYWSRVSSWFHGSRHSFSSWQQKKTWEIRDKQTHKYYKCPNCGNKLRVPKGKGKIMITCPVCKTEFIKKT